MASPDIPSAAQFLAAHARVLDWRRFERLFQDAPAGPVRDAVAAYQNDDGGLGHALEPDGRGPGSQPSAVALGLRALDEADAWDDALVSRVCEWLERTAPPSGGTTFVDPNIVGWPHAPWWQPEPGAPPSRLCTGLIAGTLHAHRVEHRWVERATEWMWSALDKLDDVGPYDMRGLLGFLQHVPDRARADRAFERVGARLLQSDLVTLEVDASGEAHGPLDYAPLPDSIARRVFAKETIEAHLDRLAAGQRDDGGWTFNWPAWSTAAELDWRGSVTVDALVTLRANNRL